MANTVAVTIVANGTQYSATMARAERAARQFGAANNSLGQAVDGTSRRMREMAASTRAASAEASEAITKYQAVSSNLRIFEGGIQNSLRAGERFIAQSSLLSKIAMQTFPAAGAFAVGAIAFRAYTHISEFIDKLKEMPEAVNEGFLALVSSARDANDVLASTNQHLRDQIADLEGTPANHLLDALVESRIAADRLSDSLSKDYKQVQALLSANQVGLIGQLIGRGSSKAIDTQLTGYEQRMSEAALAYRESLDTNDKALQDRQRASLTQIQNQAVAYAKQQIALRTASQNARMTPANQPFTVNGPGITPYGPVFTGSTATMGDQTRNLNALRGFLDIVQEQIDSEQLTAEHDRLQGRVHDLQRNRSVGQSQIQTPMLRTGGQSRIGELQNRETTQLAQSNQRMVADLSAASNAVSALMVKQAEDVLRTGSAWSAYHQAVARGTEIQAANAASIAEAKIQIETTTGALTQHDAAVQMATIHAQEYKDQLSALQQQQSQIASDSGLSASDRASALQRNANQQAQLGGNRQIQILQDQQAESQTSVLASLRASISSMTQGINDALARSLIGQKGSHESLSDRVGKTLDQSAQGMAKSGLQHLEGAGMKLLGIGGQKPKGTRGDPIYTMSAASIPGASSSGAGGLLGKIFGGGGGDSDDDSDGGILGGTEAGLSGGLCFRRRCGGEPASPHRGKGTRGFCPANSRADNPEQPDRIHA